MSGYSFKESTLRGDRKPRVNLCGSCGQESDALLCDDCMDDIQESFKAAGQARGEWESTAEMERRTR